MTDEPFGWGKVTDRLVDHEKRLRDLEQWKASSGAEDKAQWKQQRDQNGRFERAISRVHERVNALPDKEDMTEHTQRMATFTTDMEARFRREETERRKSIQEITDGQQRVLQALERDRGRREASEKAGLRVSAWLIPLAVALVSVALTYLLSR